MPTVRLFSIRLRRHEFARLVDYVARYINFRNEKLQPLPCNFWPHTWFFRSSATYDLFHTCNRWTIQGLHYAGLHVSGSGVFTAGQVVSRLQEHHLLLGETR
ncbi:DUF2459 domain-containing protein [Acidithiobacillus sp. IBUN Pt1247-S3]|uniref:DUF2459 domain-containing protein n=1 Tax=Acidithiobacillus sp. IBUN Pt1247-S3 TaxID=3166642 RepID=UPI0034E4CCEF